MLKLFKKVLLLGVIAVAVATSHVVWAMEANKRGEHLLDLIKKGAKEEVAKYLEKCSKEDVNYEDQKGNLPFVEVAHKGWHDLIEQMIKKGAQVDWKSLWGRSALCHAICFAPKKSVYQTVKVLLRNGANPNMYTYGTFEETIFCDVCAGGDPDLIKLFFDPEVKFAPILTRPINPYNLSSGIPTRSPLAKILCGYHPSLEIVKLFVENGADVDEQIVGSIVHTCEEIDECTEFGQAYTLYTLIEWVKEFRQKEDYPNYPTQEIVDYLTAVSLEKKRIDAIKKSGPLPTRYNAIVPYNPAPVIGLLKLEK